MKRCKTCRWWSDDEQWWTPVGCFECLHPKITEPFGYEGDANCLVYAYDEGGGFASGPEFGCVHWEARTET